MKLVKLKKNLFYLKYEIDNDFWNELEKII